MSAYLVWVVDCECGAYVTYGEDLSTLPEECEECGEPFEVTG